MDTTTTVKHFIVTEFAPDVEADGLDVDYDLLDAGILDSLGLLVVIAWIEERFGVTVDVGEVVEGDFRSVSAICAQIAQAQRAPEPAQGASDTAQRAPEREPR